MLDFHHRLPSWLCGLEDRSPGSEWKLEGELDVPEPLSPVGGKPQPLQ